MGAGVLADTNTVIDFLDNALPPAANAVLDANTHGISVNTRIELLGWSGATGDQLTRLANYIDRSEVFPLLEAIILQTIELRRHHRIRLPDAVIAATALVHDLPLYSRNMRDFTGVPYLTVIDPHTL